MGTITTNINSLFPTSPIGGGGGKVSVYNEGTLVSDNVKILDFLGADVNVIQDPLDNTKVNIQIPASLIASHFNTNDGISSAIVNSISTSNRNVATSLGTYNIGDWVENSVKPCINNTAITYATPSFFSILNNTTTTFSVNVYSGDGVTSIASHSITITGNTDITLNNIRIVISNFQADDTKYKAQISVTINIKSILPVGGRFSIKLEHNDGAEGIYTKTQNDVFMDSDNNAPVISNPTYSINVPVFKYLSGVKYYTKNTTVNTGIGNINYLNDRSYPNTQINILGSELGLPQINLTGSQLTDWTSNYNNINASYTNNSWAITTDNYYAKGLLKIQARWIDWVNGTLQNSLTQSLLIDTYLVNRTRIKEDFNDETYRLKNNYTLWDSTQKLDVYIDNTDGLLLENSKLYYPQLAYNTYNPDDISQPDYTALTGDRLFTSYFYYTNVSKSNGIFGLTDHNITETDITNEDVKIEISLNGTDWFNCNTSYFGGVLVDGAGCRIDTSTYNLSNNRLRFTLSTLFTSNSTGSSLGGYWGIFFRITYKDNATAKNKYIGSIELLDWI